MDFLYAAVLLIGAVVAGVAKLFETVGFVIPLILVTAGVALYIWYQNEQKKKMRKKAEARKAAFLQKYKDTKVVDDILSRRIWVGQTQEQLIDAIGRPHDIDQKVMKTKKKEVWKYGHKGANRYKYRITLDNDLVIGWDEKA